MLSQLGQKMLKVQTVEQKAGTNINEKSQRRHKTSIWIV